MASRPPAEPTPPDASGTTPLTAAGPQGAAAAQAASQAGALPPSDRQAGSQTFRFVEPHLLEVDFSGKVFIKQGTVYSYSGDLTFWVKDKRPGGSTALVIITGRGRLLLTDKDREITLMHVDEEAVFVEPSHLLACEETLTPRYVRLEDSAAADRVEFIQLEGHGMVALSAASRPLTLTVTPDLPVSVPAGSLIMWTGPLAPSPVADREIYEFLQPPGAAAQPLIRLQGRGRILMEQGRASTPTG